MPLGWKNMENTPNASLPDIQWAENDNYLTWMLLTNSELEKEENWHVLFGAKPGEVGSVSCSDDWTDLLCKEYCGSYEGCHA